MIKNIEKLSLTQEQLGELNTIAGLHKRFANFDFEIIEVVNKELTIKIKQGKSAHTNYADTKKMIEIVKEMFLPVLGEGWIIHVHPFPYIASPVEVVTPEWISKQMNSLKIKLKDMVMDTGVEKAELSAMINNHRPISQRSKAMFYYYFQTKQILLKPAVKSEMTSSLRKHNSVKSINEKGTPKRKINTHTA